MSQQILTQAQAMLSALLGIKKQVPDRTEGLCSNIDAELLNMQREAQEQAEEELLEATFWDSYKLLNLAFMSWPKFSGIGAYPIPSTKRDLEPSTAYAFLEKWSRRSQYGKLRWELLDHCIEYFQQQANQANQIQGDSHASS